MTRMVDFSDSAKEQEEMKWTSSTSTQSDTSIPLSELGCFGTLLFIIVLTLAKALGWIP